MIESTPDKVKERNAWEALYSDLTTSLNLDQPGQLAAALLKDLVLNSGVWPLSKHSKQ